MVEFAFVNSIWRRKYDVPIKKLNSKHILKSTLSPHLMRRRTSHARSRSFSGSARQADNTSLGGNLPYNNYLTVNLPITTITEGQVLGPSTAPGRRGSLHMLTNSNRKLDVTFVENAFGAAAASATTPATPVAAPAVSVEIPDMSANNNNNINIGEEFTHEEEIAHAGWTTLTPQEIAIWIDRRARFIFPVAFLVFNMFFWTFVYCI